MRIAGAFLSNRAEIHDTLLYVMGGFPEWWGIPELPSRQTLALALVLEVEVSELGKTVELGVRFVAGDRTLFDQVMQVETGPVRTDFVAGAPMYRQFIMNLSVEFEQVGLHEIVLSDRDGLELSRVRFGVRVLA